MLSWLAVLKFLWYSCRQRLEQVMVSGHIKHNWIECGMYSSHMGLPCNILFQASEINFKSRSFDSCQ